MNGRIHIDDIYFNKTQFDSMIGYCEEQYGFEGQAWDEVKSSKDVKVLLEFLEDDGVICGEED
ncbi:hypothetical protein [Bacillus mycoides]|uniref:hypothetical protein n=1 Tax=Bacillus mycoides TaxID=1405 RepID=UPI0035561231